MRNEEWPSSGDTRIVMAGHHFDRHEKKDMHDNPNAQAELDAQTQRIGIDWGLVAERLLARHPELLPDAPVAESDPLIGFAALDMLPLLRTLPDGAGTDAFIDALDGK